MEKIVCQKQDEDMFLLFTRTFCQIFDGEKFITILGEKHNDDTRSSDNNPYLTQSQYIYKSMSNVSGDTLVELEIQNDSEVIVPSFNLQQFTTSTHKGFVVENADIRRAVLFLPDKQGFWLDILQVNHSCTSLTYNEFIILETNVLNFYIYIKNDPLTPHSLKNYIDYFINLVHNLRINILKNFNPEIDGRFFNDKKNLPKHWNDEYKIQDNWGKFNYKNYAKTFRKIQISVLDINMLFNMYRHNKSNNVFVCGAHHVLTLHNYFKSSGANILSVKHSTKNTINLKGTIIPTTIQQCLQELTAAAEEKS